LEYSLLTLQVIARKKKGEGQGREERQDNKILNPKKNRFQLGKKDETGVNMASN
jgi:hypothetical protein